MVLDLKAWRGHGEQPRLSLCDRSTRVPEESPSEATEEGAAQRQQEIPAFENAKNNSSSGVEFSRSLEDDRVCCRRWRSDLSPLELLSQW